MRKLFSLLAFISLMGFVSLAGQTQEMKIGFINLTQVFENTTVYKQAFQELRQVQKQKSEEIQQKEDQLRKSKYELEVRKDLITEENAKQLEQSFRKEVSEFQDLLRQEQKTFAEMRDKKLEPINQQLKKVIEQVAKSENIVMVFKDDDLLYAAPQLDITSKVIELMNQQ